MESWDPDAPMNKTAPDASMAAKGGKKGRGISRIPPSPLRWMFDFAFVASKIRLGRNTGADNRSSFCPVL